MIALYSRSVMFLVSAIDTPAWTTMKAILSADLSAITLLGLTHLGTLIERL
jgi:hypothetical protein